MVLSKNDCGMVLSALAETYPDAKPELEYDSPFTLLVAVILSAQCTDKRVNQVTSVLFKKYSTPNAFADLSQDELEHFIKPCGFYHEKAAHIIATAKILRDSYGGVVPDSTDKLMKLPGVGRKTANVVYSVAFGGDAIAVDTHVFRVSHRLNLSDAKDVLGTEKQLHALIADGMRGKAHHLLIFHGRRCCTARKPSCEKCSVTKYCNYGGKHE